MKKTKTILLLAVFALGFALSSCHTKQSCPAYGNAHKGSAKHRSI